MNRFKIKDWELLKGIELKNTDGFKIPRNKVHNILFTEREFKKGAIKSNIVVKTDKGMDFLKEY